MYVPKGHRTVQKRTQFLSFICYTQHLGPPLVGQRCTGIMLSRYHTEFLKNCLGNEFLLNHINAVELSAFVDEKKHHIFGEDDDSKQHGSGDLESLGVEAGKNASEIKVT